MTEIVAGSERGFHIASVMRIDIHRIVCSACLGCFNEAFHNRIAVGTAAVLGTDGNLLFRALQAFTHAAHIHGNGFCASFRDIAGSAVADLFKNGDVGIKRALRDNLFIPDVFRKSKENADAQFVIQETGFDVTGFGDPDIRLKAYDIANRDTELFRVFLFLYILIQDNLTGVPSAFDVVVLAVHMDRSVAELEGSFIDAVEFCHNTHILRFGVVGIHTAQVGETETSVSFDFRNHTAKGIDMRFQKQTVILVAAAERNKYSAFVGKLCVKTKFRKFIQYPRGRIFRIACRGIDVQEGFGFLNQEICVLLQTDLFHNKSLCSLCYSSGCFCASDLLSVSTLASSFPS